MFQVAKKALSFIKICLNGPSGSGKSFTAQLIAHGIIDALGGGAIAVIDTESGSMSLYAGQFQFQVVNLTPPFTTAKLVQAMKEAERLGFKVLIIDSASSQWIEMLERKSLLDARGGNSFTNWAKLTPEHDKFMDEILNLKMHVICTVRAKQDYAPQMNEQGRMTGVQKLGMAPIQRDNFEYIFTTCFNLAMNHSAIASKDRTGLFSTTHPFVPSRETGIQFMNWLNESESKTSAK